MKKWLAALVVLGVSSPAAWAGRSIYRPYPGTTFIYDKSLEQKTHIIKIDLKNRKVRLRYASGSDIVTASGAANPMGPHTFAKKRRLQMATNGSIGGKSADYMWVSGLVKSYGKMWPRKSAQPKAYMKGDVGVCYPTPGNPVQNCTSDGLLALSADNQKILMHTVGQKSFPDHKIPADYDVAAGGRPVILWDGKVVDTVVPYAYQYDKCSPAACTVNPRTAYGISKNKEMMIFAVVDGRQSGRKGMTSKQLGAMMKKHGAWWAYNLDGGGSSAMYIKGLKNMSGSSAFPAGIVNRPSDGSVRQVPLQLGIQIVKPYGHLKGTVRAGDPTTGTPIPGAQVQVAFWDKDCVMQVKSAVTAADGSYRIDLIYGGTHNVVASAPNFKGITKSKLIAAGDMNRMSFGLAATGGADSSTAINILSTPSTDLEDDVAIKAGRVSFSAIPSGVLAASDKDPDFPSGGKAADDGLPNNYHPIRVCVGSDAGVLSDAAVALGDAATAAVDAAAMESPDGGVDGDVTPDDVTPDDVPPDDATPGDATPDDPGGSVAANGCGINSTSTSFTGCIVVMLLVALSFLARRRRR